MNNIQFSIVENTNDKPLIIECSEFEGFCISEGLSEHPNSDIEHKLTLTILDKRDDLQTGTYTSKELDSAIPDGKLPAGNTEVEVVDSRPGNGRVNRKRTKGHARNIIILQKGKS